jgi:hypothetical protein
MAAKKKLVTLIVDVAAIGKKGGEARAAKMTAKQRSEAASAAVNARWAGHVAKRPASSRKKPAPKKGKA